MQCNAIEALEKMLATLFTTSEIKLFQGVRMTAWARPTICSHGMRACVGQWEVTLCMNPSWRRSTATGSTMSSGVLTTRAIQSLCWSPSLADGNSCTIQRIEPGAALTTQCDNANLTPPVQKRSQLCFGAQWQGLGHWMEVSCGGNFLEQLGLKQGGVGFR